MANRYALYLAPHPKSELHRFASAWLGRDAVTGEALAQPSVLHVSPGKLEEITTSPRRYGFHATIKPPFRLAAGRNETELLAAVERFAATQASFEINLEVQSLRGFLAFCLRRPSAELDAFASACMRDFEPFRAPAGEAEIERRKRAPLTPRHLENLDRWGYPYVFEDFVFHMTLTERLANNLHDRVLTDLCERTRSLTAEPFRVDALAVFVEDQPHGPFRLLRRVPLGG